MKGRKKASLAAHFSDNDEQDLNEQNSSGLDRPHHQQQQKQTHSQNELMRAYQAQRRVMAPESFDCIDESGSSAAIGTSEDIGPTFEASASFPATQQTMQDFPQSQSDGQFHKAVAMALPAQVHCNKRANYNLNNVVGQQTSSSALRSSEALPLGGGGADSFRSPWLSQNRSSNMPKSSFNLSLSLSVSSHNNHAQQNEDDQNGGGAISVQNQRNLGQNHFSEAQEEDLSAQPGEISLRRESEQSSAIDDSSQVDSPRVVQLVEVHPLLTSEGGSSDRVQQKGVIQQSDVDQESQGEEQPGESSKAYSSFSQGALMRGGGDDMGQHLLLSSLHEPTRPQKEEVVEGLPEATDEVNLLRGLQSQAEYYRGDLAEESLNMKSHELLSPQSVQHLSRNSSKIATIRSMIEEHASRTQLQQPCRTLKRTSTVQKPSNSPMLLASAASQSASSPASGGQTNYGRDRMTQRQVRTTDKRHESMESIMVGESHRKLINALGSNSTLEVLQSRRQRLLIVAAAGNGEGNEQLVDCESEPGRVMIDLQQAQSQEERIMFNDYADTTKRLRFDNMSGSSLILSKSGESSSAVGTTISKKLRGGRSNTIKNRYDAYLKEQAYVGGGGGGSSASQAMQSFVVQPANGGHFVLAQQQARPSSFVDGGFHQATLRAMQGSSCSKRLTTQTMHEGQSQVSGHGSLLYQFITEGVEEDEEECKVLPVRGGDRGFDVAVNHLESHESDKTSRESQHEHSSLRSDEWQKESKPLDKQLLSGSGSLKAVTAVVAAGSSRSPSEQLHQQSSNAALQSSNFSHKVSLGGGVLLSQHDNQIPLLTRNRADKDQQQAKTGQILIDSFVDGEEAAILQLEAIKSEDGGNRPVVSPDPNRFRDDEIQRVVSQVRDMEREIAEEGTNLNYKFEIERTDSLEFTRNSVTGDGDESHARALSSQSSKRDGLKIGHSRDLDRTKDQVKRSETEQAQVRRSTDHNDLKCQNRHSTENFDSNEESNLDHIKETLCGIQYQQPSTPPAESSEQRSQKNKQLHPLFESQLLSNQSQPQKEPITSSSFEEPPELDLNERSATSSQYKVQCSGPVLLQDDSYTATAFRDQDNRTSSVALVTGESRHTTHNTGYNNKNFFIPSELPHASSKIFDEGDMPIPAKFRRKKTIHNSSKPHTLVDTKSTTRHPSPPKPQEDLAWEEQDTREQLLKRSRVKDHVNRFIRQSQDLGTSLGLIDEQKSIERAQPPPSTRAGHCQSFKQSLLVQPQQLLSPQKVQSVNYRLSQAKQSNLEFISAINRDGQTNLPSSSVCSNDLFLAPIVQDQQAQTSSSNNEQAAAITNTNPMLLKSSGIITYKDSHFHQEAQYGQRDGCEQQSYSDLVGSQILQQMAIDSAMGAMVGADMPQSSIGYVMPDQAVYQERQLRRMNAAGSTFEYVKEEFNRQNYFKQLQSLGSAEHPAQSDGLTSESDNFGQFPNSARHRNHPLKVFQEGLDQQQQASYRVSEYTPSHQQQQYYQPSTSGRTGEQLEVLDQSAAEYDCADEDMDGPDSICVDDLILQQNRARVQQMSIQKPILNTIPGQKNQPMLQFEKKDKATTVLKKLLFPARDVQSSSQPRLQQPEVTRNTTSKGATGDSFLQLQTKTSGLRSASSKTKKAFSFADNTYLKGMIVDPPLTTRNQRQTTPKKLVTPTQFSVRDSQQTQKQRDLGSSSNMKLPFSAKQTSSNLKNAEARLWRTEASPLSEYQISKQQQNVVDFEQTAAYLKAVQGTPTQFQDGKNHPPMSTIMESIISIDHYNLLQHNPNTSAVQEESINMPIQTASSYKNGAQGHQHHHQMSNTTHWPSSIKKKKTRSRVHTNLVYQYQTQQKRPDQSSAQTRKGEERTHSHRYVSDQKELMYYNSAVKSQGRGHLQTNRTVLSINTSRQPTTKNELESQFMQRSQSNGSSTATRKPEMALAREDLTTQKRRFDEQRSEGRQCQRPGNQALSSKDAALRRRQPGLMTPQRPGGKSAGAKAPPTIVQEAGEPLQELQYDGRGFTESQQFSLDSDMQNLFFNQRQLPQPFHNQHQHQPDETMSWLPTLQQQTSIMFRTENNLLNSEGLQRNDESDSVSGKHHLGQLRKGFVQTLSTKKQKTSFTNMTGHSSLIMANNNCGSSDQNQHQLHDQSGGTNCRNCTLEKRKRSITQTAFQNAIKMTQYLMKEIERLQQTNEEAAVLSEQQMAQILMQNYNDEADSLCDSAGESCEQQECVRSRGQQKLIYLTEGRNCYFSHGEGQQMLVERQEAWQGSSDQYSGRLERH